MVISKKRLKQLRTSFNNVPNEQSLTSEDLLANNIKEYFRNHIGKDEAVDNVKLFSDIYNVDPFDLDIFKRAYFDKILKKAMKSLRRQVFIVSKAGKWFVLQSDDEVDDYDKICDRTVENIKDSQKRARDWVRDKKWKRF